jgi:hypothetical protein
MESYLSLPSANSDNSSLGQGLGAELDELDFGPTRLLEG